MYVKFNNENVVSHRESGVHAMGVERFHRIGCSNVWQPVLQQVFTVLSVLENVRKKCTIGNNQSNNAASNYSSDIRIQKYTIQESVLDKYKTNEIREGKSSFELNHDVDDHDYCVRSNQENPPSPC